MPQSSPTERAALRPRIARALLGVLLLAGGAACGLNGDEPASTTSTSPVAATSTPPAGSSSTDDASHAPAAGNTTSLVAKPVAPTTSTPPAPAGFTNPDSAPADNTAMLQARIEPRCVEHDDVVTFTVRTEPGAAVNAQASLADGAFSALPRKDGVANSKGDFVWRLDINDDAGEGGARLMVSVHSEDRQRRASGSFSFEIAEPGGCPQ